MVHSASSSVTTSSNPGGAGSFPNAPTPPEYILRSFLTGLYGSTLDMRQHSMIGWLTAANVRVVFEGIRLLTYSVRTKENRYSEPRNVLRAALTTGRKRVHSTRCCKPNWEQSQT